MGQYYIIDFDSTFTQVEALDELARISLKDRPDREDIYKQIEDLTNASMEGRLSFTQSLAARVKLLEATRDDLKLLVKHLRKKVSVSFSRNSVFFKNHADEVLIVSGGFKEFITPVVSEYHIKQENIYANTFLFDERGKIIGYDETNPLSQEGGKVKLLKELDLQGDIFGIGDGYSDFQLKESGMIKKFFAYTENIERKSVTERADHITPSFDEFLYINKLPRAISYPKNRIKCLVVGDIDEEALAQMRKEGYNIRQKDHIEDVYLQEAGILFCDEANQPSPEQLQNAGRLKVIGCFGRVQSRKLGEAACAAGIIIFDDRKDNPRSFDFIPKRVIAFMNEGKTHTSCNFPDLQPPRVSNAHRLIHIHKNVPGILAKINDVFARHNINIVGEFLVTNAQIGYVITDVNTGYDTQVLEELKAIEQTIKFRLLY
ncbi:HAD-IB family phosphatase [Mucilaginibacter myungsuensis]|uniref:phosphoserine phosphatase n=1 Tax=Mucilaginibacter myungsuensis TaxID=649104 RepID=A0A929KWP2_9SPHI|nr:HAD-IB family phosphatase [Mucilaginibacter myungsuensis]MBE9662562.1 HAD-IB family phosphatase [Mucilaginibacter myungsuensis]MDN3597982.1 HAD-IB family phosphatase [Mucilaginibacter myungsuensis]